MQHFAEEHQLQALFAPQQEEQAGYPQTTGRADYFRNSCGLTQFSFTVPVNAAIKLSTAQAGHAVARFMGGGADAATPPRSAC